MFHSGNKFADQICIFDSVSFHATADIHQIRMQHPDSVLYIFYIQTACQNKLTVLCFQFFRKYKCLFFCFPSESFTGSIFCSVYHIPPDIGWLYKQLICIFPCTSCDILRTFILFWSEIKNLAVKSHSQGRIYVSWCHPLFIVLCTISIRYGISSISFPCNVRTRHPLLTATCVRFASHKSIPFILTCRNLTITDSL